MPCLVCGTPTGTKPRCAAHPYQPRRGGTTARGYGIEHQRRAARLRAEGRPCCLCGDPIDYDLRAPHPWSFAAHHLTTDKSGPLDAAHRRCNEREGKPDGGWGVSSQTRDPR